jgi:photosystem II stability/assembly factor-like uncharacterized protein
VDGPDFWNSYLDPHTLVGEIAPFNTTNAFAYGGPGGGSAVDVTTDGGRTWWNSEIGYNTPTAAVVGNDVWVMAFGTNPAKGKGSLWLYTSDNGGRSWSYRSTVPTVTGSAAELVRPSATTAYLLVTSQTPGGTPGIERTTNGGVSWSRVSDPCVTADAPQLPVNEQIGSSNPSSVWLLCGEPAKPAKGLSPGEMTCVERSIDGGSTWSLVASPTTVGSSFSAAGRLGGVGAIGLDTFLSPTEAWVDYSPSGPLVKTDNGGVTWVNGAPKGIEGDAPRQIFAVGGLIYLVTDHSLYRESAGKWTQIATGYVAPTTKA